MIQFRRFLSLAVLFLPLAIVVVASPGNPAANGSAPSDSFEAFLDAPSWESWSRFAADVNAGRYGRPDTAFPQLLDYHSAREKRDLPNSMAVTGIPPDEFAKLQAARADSALANIQRGLTNDVWCVLQALASQAYDDGLVFTSAEIAARLQPVRFERIAKEAIEAHPANAWIFERTRERWLRPRKEGTVRNIVRGLVIDRFVSMNGPSNWIAN